MSMSNTVYVGPYIEAREPVKREVTRSVDGCLDRECRGYGNWSGSPYCPRCGKKTGHGQERVTEPIDWFDVSEAIDEALHEGSGEGRGDEVHYWIPNVTRPDAPMRNMRFDRETETAARPILPADVQSEVDWLVSAFAPEIDKMREFYGVLVVRWGTLVWWS